MALPPVSVLMAVFNGEPFLEDSLRSICGQSFRDWEFVVVDDASTDRTREIVGAWSGRDPRIRLVVNDANKGQTPCLNQGLRECRGRWVARQDADDISHGSRLAEQVACLERHPGTALLGTQGILIDARGKRVGLLDVPCGKDGIAWSAPFLNPFLHTSVMFQRTAVLDAGAYDESYSIAQDYELWTRIAAGRECANLPGRLVSYRHTDSSLSRAGRDRAFAEADRVSAREAVWLLGRNWSAAEEMLVGKFRSGLPAESRREFWQMIVRLEKELGRSLPRDVRAAWHLRMAGSAREAAAVEMAAAFRASPAFTTRWIFDRCFSF